MQQHHSLDDLPGGGLGHALLDAAAAWRAELADALAPLGVTPPQFLVLAALLHRHSRNRPPLIQRDLAERTGMDVNTVSQVVRGLEGRGLVERARHPEDTRAVVLGLTPAGLDLSREAAREARALNRRYFAGVDAAHLHGVLTGLARRSRDRRDG